MGNIVKNTPNVCIRGIYFALNPGEPESVYLWAPISGPGPGVSNILEPGNLRNTTSLFLLGALFLRRYIHPIPVQKNLALFYKPTVCVSYLLLQICID